MSGRMDEKSPRTPKTGTRDRETSPPELSTQERGPAPADHDPGGTEPLTHLQRSAGNQAVVGMLGGRAIPGHLRGRMESAFGHPFGDVRIHTGQRGDRVAREAGAQAVTTGDHVFFRSGRFRPETTVGEALLAHELAHVAHRHGLQEGESTAALEAEANRSTFLAMANLHLGTRERIPLRSRRGGKGMGRVLPLSCIGRSSAIEAPDYLGPHSRRTLESLNSRLGSLDALGPVIAVGTAVTVGAGPPSDPSDTVEMAAQALRGLPAWKRAIITEEVTLLLVSHENDMNAQERRFWHRILDGA